MISRLLIANRGEIAARIARTAARMGIETVGVYAEPDRDALHVDAVDLAVALGGSTPAESYLRADAVIEAATRTGCDAVHPGYGFLAENAEFAEQVVAAGLLWVGPTPAQIRALGDKIAAKKTALDAGVPTAELVEVAPGEVPSDVPFPALVKAAGGGGGRGMRVVRSADQLAAAIDAGSREAEAAFGDGTVFIEPYLERARHVEVQIIGDQHGNVVHLGERECSIQRRNQKIVEESPSAGISEATRTALCDGAVALARAAGYHGAGTVEFLVGADGTVNFLEVNTRLQVEHPVTEAVTGLDLVELQLRVAAGEALPIGQDDVRIDGHAIEVRVVAEDPARGWLPSTGVVRAFDVADGVRVDTGFRAGSVVSAEYDSLLAKVVSHAPTRAESAARLRVALRRSVVSGVETNVACLAAILGEADFLAADTTTAYLDEHPAVSTALGSEGDDRDALVVAATLAVETHNRSTDAVTGFAPSGWRNLRTRGQRSIWQTGPVDDPVEHRVEYVLRGSGADVAVGPWPEPRDDGSLPPDARRWLSVRRLASSTVDRPVLEIDGVRRTFRVIVDGDAVVAASPQGAVTLRAVPRFVVHDVDEGGSGPVSPLPGTVIDVRVEVGQQVAEGEVLVVVEAMKMEHAIAAVGPAVVEEVRFGVGDRVDAGDLLVVLRPDDDHD